MRADLHHVLVAMPIEVVVIPPDQRDPRWWEHSDICVRWEIHRHSSLPVVSAKGRIVIQHWDDDTGEPSDVELGEIQIAKAALGDFDVMLELDALSMDHCALAVPLFDGDFYSEAFGEWFEDTFWSHPLGDPVLIMDMKLPPEHRDEEGKVAAHAVLDAATVFGGATSPIVTFHESYIEDVARREAYEKQGLWAWIEPLRAERYDNVYVAVRPRD